MFNSRKNTNNSNGSSQYESMGNYELELQAVKKDTDINEVISEASKRVADGKMEPFELRRIIATFSDDKRQQIKRESFYPYITISDEEAVKILYGIKSKIGSYLYNVGQYFNAQRYPHFGSFTSDIDKINVDSNTPPHALSNIEERIMLHVVLALAKNEASGTSYARKLDEIVKDAEKFKPSSSSGAYKSPNKKV